MVAFFFRVPGNILNAMYADLLKSLMEPLNRYRESSNTMLLTSCLKSLCWILKSIGDHMWSESKVVAECFYSILHFATHDKSRVRKCCRDGVNSILHSYRTFQQQATNEANNTSSKTYGLISSVTADYILKLIKDETMSKTTSDANSDATSANVGKKRHNVMHALNTIKAVIVHFSSSKLKDTGDLLFRLIKSKNDVSLSFFLVCAFCCCCCKKLILNCCCCCRLSRSAVFTYSRSCSTPRRPCSRPS